MRNWGKTEGDFRKYGGKGSVHMTMDLNQPKGRHNNYIHVHLKVNGSMVHD